MARKLSTREATLLAVLGLAAAVALYVAMGAKDTPGGSLRAKALDAGKKQGETAQDKPPVVHTELLAVGIESFDPSGRDLFKYAPRPPSPREIRRAREEAERRRRDAEIAAKRAAEDEARRRVEEEARARELALHPLPPPPPTPPSVTFRYLGYLGPKDAKVAIFEDGKDLLLARKGEIVKEQFRVVEIKWETVVVGFVKPEFKGQTRELAMMRK